MAVQLKLAEAFVDVEINRAAFDTGLARVVADLGRLKGLGTVTLRLDRADATASLNLFRQQLEALGKTATVTVRAAMTGVTGGGVGGGGGAASAGMVGLAKLQMSGIALQNQLANAAAKAAAQAAAPPPGMVGLGSLQMSGIKLQTNLANAATQATAQAAKQAADLDAIQDRYVKKDYDRRVRYEAMKLAAQEAAAGRAAALQEREVARVNAGMRQTLSQGGMGLAQGLGLGQFAMSPSMMAGQMIGGGLKDAVGTAMELQSTFLDLQRVTGESAGNIEKFKQSVFDIAAKQAGVSVADVTGIAIAGAKAGISDKEGMAGLERYTAGIAKIKNALGDREGLNAEQLTEDVSRMLGLFGKGTGEIEGFGSALVKMANLSTASAGGIIDTMKGLSGTFASMKMNAIEAMSLSSVITDAGLTNQQGASAFQQIFRNMAAESGKYADAIGMPLERFRDLIRGDAMAGLEALIGKFNELNAIDPIKGQEWLVSLGLRGIRTAGSLQQVATMVGEIRRRTAIGLEEERTHAALTEADKLKGSGSESGVLKLRNAFVELGDAMGKHFLGPMDAVTGRMTTAVRSLAGSLTQTPMVNDPVTGKPVRRTQENSMMGPFGLVMRPEAVPEPAKPPAKPPGPDLGEIRNKQLAAVAEDNARRAAEAERQRKARFLPTDADRAAALEEVGPARENAKGEVSDKDRKAHDEAVFRHAQRIQGERLEKDFGDKMARGGDAENNARLLGEKMSHFGRMALGVMLAEPDEKMGIAAGLAGRAAGAVTDAAGRPLKGAGKALAGLGPDEIDETKLGKKKEFRSEHFAGGDEFAQSFISAMLSGKDKTPEEQLREAKEQTKHLAEIKAALKPTKGKTNSAAVMTGRS